jgi:hypothetical protein
MPCKVDATSLETISPETRASRPITILVLCEFFFAHSAYAAVNFTTSIGLSVSPLLPPIVPLIPEIDLINDTLRSFSV